MAQLAVDVQLERLSDLVLAEAEAKVVPANKATRPLLADVLDADDKAPSVLAELDKAILPIAVKTSCIEIESRFLIGQQPHATQVTGQYAQAKTEGVGRSAA